MVDTIQSTILTFLVLATIEAVILFVAGHPRTKKYFNFLPAVFWIYFVPMLVSCAGLINTKSQLYDWATTYGLPASLFLLLLGVNLKAIARLGRTALLMFLAGSLGIMGGTVLTFVIFRPFVGVEFWSGFAALSASWTGGSANMIAVKEALGTPNDVFLPMVVVDTVVPYVWMGLLIAASKGQVSFDRWNHCEARVLDHIRERIASIQTVQPLAPRGKNVVFLIGLAFAVSLGVQSIAKALPVIEGVISNFAWAIILVSVVGLAASLTPLCRYEGGSTRVGYYLLYFVLTTIGAKASVSHLGTSVILIAAGTVIVLIHAIVLLIAARWLRAPLMLVATASQANIGGVVSAPVVAETYQPGLASLGLLLAILGNVMGTYLGIIVGQICRG